MKRRIRKRTLLAAAFVVAAAGWGALEWAIRSRELPPSLGHGHASTRVHDRHGVLLAEIGNGGDVRSCRPVAMARISPWVVRATLAAEDRRFFEHQGVDLRALAGAAWRNLRSGEVVSGASTISQQLIKLHTPHRARGWSAKIGENLTAIQLERRWPKRRILEAYLNRIDYGNGLRGIEAAAMGYFGKPAEDLDASEAAFLAGLPQAPSRHNPWKNPAAASARYHQVVALMRRDGWGATPFSAEAPVVLARVATRVIAPHFVRHVMAHADGPVPRIDTTLDAGLQATVEAILARHTHRLARQRAGNIAAVVIDHRNGDIRAWCGSNAWHGRAGQLDGVTLPRSGGSTLKPFLYLQAIDERKITAATLLPDTPDAIRAVYPDYDPRNFDERFWGPVRAREALASSLNVPAVRVLARVGARSFVRDLAQAGIPLQRGVDESGAGLILGNAEVRMLDLAGAFGAFANQGMHATPRWNAGAPVRRRAIASAQAATILADILADNDARLKTFGPDSPLAFEGVRIPCKTGTSSGFHDAWTVGATGRHVVAVWVGNFDGNPMNEVASVTGPAPIWRAIIDHLLENDGGVSIDTAMEGLVRAEICPLSGHAWEGNGAGGVPEWFLSGSGPEPGAGRFFTAGKVTLPAEYAIWCHSAHNHLGATTEPGGALRIVVPMDGSTYLFEAGLPRERQGIRFLAAGAGGPLVWEINGEPLEADGDGHVFWPMQAGAHRLRATSADDSAEVFFEVK